MASRTQMLLAELAALLNSLPGVFSTPQWGGRAYKVPRGTSGKPKLLAHVTPVDREDAVTVSFKLQPPEAADQVERHDWITPHSFRTLAPSGWVTARVSTKRHVATLRKLLRESHGLHGVVTASDPGPKQAGGDDSARIDRVLGEAKDGGWTPQSDW
jgi:predicted DNA-binding protein (MmcQ/YjbR family)